MKTPSFARFLIFIFVVIVLLVPMLVWTGAPLSEPVIQPLAPKAEAPLPTSIAGQQQ